MGKEQAVQKAKWLLLTHKMNGEEDCPTTRIAPLLTLVDGY